jgi:hypothetical protein
MELLVSNREEHDSDEYQKDDYLQPNGKFCDGLVLPPSALEVFSIT